MSDTPHIVRQSLLDAFRSAADPARAPQQQAYMKSEMPFLGVMVPAMRKLARAVFKAHPPADAEDWQQTILELWRQAEFREERYAAIELLLANRHMSWLTPARVPLLQELITTGAWWDYVDGIAARALGHLLAHHPAETKPMLRDWAHHEDLWIRRAAILAQLKAKNTTDPALLRDCIEPSLESSEFFLRKAIGWALREYSKTDPEAVAAFVDDHADRLSGLSRREALKVIEKRRGRE